ncbi:hypothetical protein SARC_10841 [Sphaeroforma arctica JP610]|uniref:Uncharacterized protein n=1 Tax=Sphaeroforma arctica JP610 TaxID=667725 RepID=A0A0L0FIU8_9EUKA|nr:hypothetical protein SARC_10841 [Sphaeroforma arctica JP610]KNC76670.1 hypothetical protein SARC_10841 [Sphaeroforma arctica JP610]|eukprot:XP_014150572.1 hypothetical protein SARC_10841 [Sphaeroforma arctica JP610]
MDETIGDDTPGYVRQNSELMDATEIRQKLSDRKKAEDLLKEEERKAQNSSPVTPYINTTPSRAPVFIGIHHTILAKEVDTDATTDADKDDNGHSPAHTETQTHTDNHTESDASTASGTSVMANPPPFTGIHGMVQNGDVSVSGGTNSTAPEKPDYRMDMLMDIFRKESINGHLNCTGPCCKTKRPS